MQDALIGVGSALRKAREHRHVTIDEASRGTKIRPDYLEALEEEDFDVLLGEVYVRGALRSYASYLGLDPEKVLRAYAEGAGVAAPPPPGPPGQIRREIGAARRRDNHRLAILVVVVVVIAAAGFGLLSSRNSAPSPADLPGGMVPVDPATTVIVGVAAERGVEVVLTIDSIEQPPVALRPGEARTFEGQQLITVWLSRGGVAGVTVNGTDLGVVGRPGKPWEQTFSPTSVASPTPTGPSGPSGSVEPSERTSPSEEVSTSPNA